MHTARGPDAVLDTFAARLRDLRTRAGLSCEQLAAAAGLARAAVYKIEAGADPKWTTVCRLASALGVSTEQFRGKMTG